MKQKIQYQSVVAFRIIHLACSSAPSTVQSTAIWHLMDLIHAVKSTGRWVSFRRSDDQRTGME